MLFPRRKLWWWTALGAVAFACNQGTPVNTIVPTPTSVLITPEAFLGPVACGVETGGLLSYQATLIDVTEGLEGAPVLPSSPVALCTSTIVFETVQIGHRYAARIAAFDRSGLRAESQGSQTVVDEDGSEVTPAWTTLCTGYDGEIGLALGGAGGVGGEGGGPANTSLGVLAIEHAAVPIRGCAPLSGEFDPELTGVRLDLTRFLGSLSCGDEAGQVLDFAVELATGGVEVGGAGGIGGMGGSVDMGPARTACDVPYILRGLEPGAWIDLEVLAFEPEASEPSWSTSCDARTELGALTDVSCGPLLPL